MYKSGESAILHREWSNNNGNWCTGNYGKSEGLQKQKSNRSSKSVPWGRSSGSWSTKRTCCQKNLFLSARQSWKDLWTKRCGWMHQGRNQFGKETNLASGDAHRRYSILPLKGTKLNFVATIGYWTSTGYSVRTTSNRMNLQMRRSCSNRWKSSTDY